MPELKDETEARPALLPYPGAKAPGGIVRRTTPAVPVGACTSRWRSARLGRPAEDQRPVCWSGLDP